MIAKFRQLANNYRFLTKLVQLVLAIICLGILSQIEEFAIPRWLWLVYCTNSLTFVFVLIALSGSYAFGENCEILDTIVTVFGVFLYVIAGFSAILRVEHYIPKDSQYDSYELILGIFFILNAAIMIAQVVLTILGMRPRFFSENSEPTIDTQNQR